MSCPSAPTQVISLAFEIANTAAVDMITSEAFRVRDSGAGTWWDVRPMLDTQEHTPAVIAQHQRMLDYAVAAGVVNVHPHEQHLVRVTGH